MTPTAWPCGVSSMLLASAALSLISVAATERTTDRIAIAVARLIATQRIRDNAIDGVTAAAVSYDGRLIAFAARTSLSSESYGCQGVYLLDRTTGLITHEDTRPDEIAACGDSGSPSLSADGQVIAFETVASHLPLGALPFPPSHVVVRHRPSGTLRTPRGVLGQQPNGHSRDPILSANGVAVAFTSDATNLVSGHDANGERTDVYLWRLDRSTVRVSVDSRGEQQESGASYSPTISGDGELVAFVSTARLAPEDTDNAADIYIRDMQRGTTSLVGRGHSPVLSADGRYLAFVARDSLVGALDRNEESDVYIYDVARRSIALVSATSQGRAANAASRKPALSADGRRIVYESVASNLGAAWGCPEVTADKNLLHDVYLLDRVTGCVARVSGSPAREWWTPSVAPAVDGAGTLVVFSSTQPTGEDDATTDFDLFARVAPALHWQFARGGAQHLRSTAPAR